MTYEEKIHEELLTVLDEVVRVCNENNIPFFLESGTLLGAARHQGFIPWDDDIDIVMPRKEYRRFLAIAPGALRPGFRLFFHPKDRDYTLFYAKVCNMDTEFVEQKDHGPRMGIFVDVFPFDDSAGTGKCERFRHYLIKSLVRIADIDKSVKPRSFTGWLKKLILKVTGSSFLLSRAEKIAARNEGKKDYLTFYSTYYNMWRQTHPKSEYAETVMLPFEGRQMPVPAGYDSVLRREYGNYMEIPPVEKRVTHHPLYVRFSDGSVMDFREKK